jgi:hypothetical protein
MAKGEWLFCTSPLLHSLEEAEAKAEAEAEEE